jgi:myo-inositol-1(or 4)-monophosphatase
MLDLPLSRNGLKPIDVATNAIRKAGSYVKDSYYKEKVVKKKGRNNLVSQVDIQSEKIVIDILKSEYPEWDIISEESFPDGKSDNYSWVIDPVDGTTNFIYGIPFIAVNIALKHQDNVLIGLTFDPLRDELFHAEKDNGTFLNEKPVRVSDISDMSQSIISCDLGYDYNNGESGLKILQKLWGKALCLRILGSAALGMSYVACGRINLYFHRSVYPWDIASGLLLIEEAGGEILIPDGLPDTGITTKLIASNKDLLKTFGEHIKDIGVNF